MRWFDEDVFGWFSLTVIALVLVVVISVEAIGRWYRGNEWRRRARRGDDD